MCINIYIYIYIYICKHGVILKSLSRSLNDTEDMLMYRYIYEYIYIQIYGCIYMYIDTYVYTYIYIYIYIICKYWVILQNLFRSLKVTGDMPVYLYIYIHT
jgi:hypothetical protein